MVKKIVQRIIWSTSIIISCVISNTISQTQWNYNPKFGGLFFKSGPVAVGHNLATAALDIKAFSIYPGLKIEYGNDKPDMFIINRGTYPMLRFSNDGGTFPGGSFSLNYLKGKSTLKTGVYFAASPLINSYINAGNVGIGTANPKYKLAVNGDIGAHEIVITHLGWSDYVFNDDYDLKPLEDVEKYIKENRHLPNIPSEQEIIEKGVAVGRMQEKLLEKIEELTLYIIEQNKIIKEHERKIAILEMNINK